MAALSAEDKFNEVKAACDKYRAKDPKFGEEKEKLLASVARLIDQYDSDINGYLVYLTTGTKEAIAIGKQYAKIKKLCKSDTAISGPTSGGKVSMDDATALKIILMQVSEFKRATAPPKRAKIVKAVMPLMTNHYMYLKERASPEEWEEIGKIVSSCKKLFPRKEETFVETLSKHQKEAPQIQVLAHGFHGYRDREISKLYEGFMPFQQGDTIKIDSTTFTFHQSELKFKNGDKVYALPDINSAIGGKKVEEITMAGNRMPEERLESLQIAINYFNGHTRLTYVFKDGVTIAIYELIKDETSGPT
eukprot:222430_1